MIKYEPVESSAQICLNRRANQDSNSERPLVSQVDAYFGSSEKFNRRYLYDQVLD